MVRSPQFWPAEGKQHCDRHRGVPAVSGGRGAHTQGRVPGGERELHRLRLSFTHSRRERAFQAQGQLQRWRAGREHKSLAHATACYFNMMKQPKLVNASPAPA